MKKVLHWLSKPFRFLIALDRNEVALNADDREHMEFIRKQREGGAE